MASRCSASLVEVVLQLGERQALVDGDGVADHVDVAVREVDDPPTRGILEVGAPDVPLVGHGPVEDRGAAGDFVQLQTGQVVADDRQGLADAVAGDAAADREQSGRQSVHVRALGGRRQRVESGIQHVPYDIGVTTGPNAAEVLLVVATLGRRPEYLSQTLASIRSQDVTADIVMVAPEGDAGVRAAADQFGATLLPDPGSLPGAINLGVDEGLDGHSYVNWLNDDDLLEPGSLRATTMALKSNPGASVAFGACRYIDGDGRELWISKAGPWAPRILSWGPDLIPQPGMLVRADAWRMAGGLDTSYRLAFDLDLLLRLKKVGALVDTGTVVSSFRWHADSLTVDDRTTNLAESERAKRAALGPMARKLAWMWEAPVRVATRQAANEVQRRARRATSR